MDAIAKKDTELSCMGVYKFLDDSHVPDGSFIPPSVNPLARQHDPNNHWRAQSLCKAILVMHDTSLLGDLRYSLQQLGQALGS